MTERVLEELVGTYLAIDRGCLLNSQYIIGEQGKWRAEADFLAVDFPDGEVWMVEVTKAPYGLRSKIAEFEGEYVHRIREQLALHHITPKIDKHPDWKIGFWIFVPKAEKAWVETKLTTAGVINSRVTALEDMMFPIWKERYR